MLIKQKPNATNELLREELEKTLGEGEILSKHRKALLKFAKERNYNIVEIKEEIVSGERLFF